MAFTLQDIGGKPANKPSSYSKTPSGASSKWFSVMTPRMSRETDFVDSIKAANAIYLVSQAGNARSACIT